MTGRLTSYDGRSWDLPVLTEWEVRLTGGIPCDSFSVSFLYSADMGAVLPDCTRFTAYGGGERIFSGVVDEYTIERSARGLVASVCGRGLAALLLDNEAEAAVYQRATMEEIYRNHVRPYGISCNKRSSIAGEYQVESGSSQWRALEGFTRAHGGFSPWITPLGELLLTEKIAGKQRTLTDEAPLLSFQKKEKRYGVLSEVLVVDKGQKSQQSVRNKAFIERGGQRRRVLYTPGQSSWSAMRYTGDYQLRESAREHITLEVELEGEFLAAPGDTIKLELTDMGLVGTYRVREAVTRCSGRGLVCQLIMGEE